MSDEQVPPVPQDGAGPTVPHEEELLRAEFGDPTNGVYAPHVDTYDDEREEA